MTGTIGSLSNTAPHDMNYTGRKIPRGVEARMELLEKRVEALEARNEARRLERLERRFDSLEDTLTRRFHWLLGVQMATVASAFGILAVGLLVR